MSLFAELATNAYFQKKTNDGFMHLLVYVDDIVIVAPNEQELSTAKSMILNRFPGKSLGFPTQILGLEIEREANGIRVRQTSAIRSAAEVFGVLGANTVDIPLAMGVRLEKETDESKVLKEVPYRELIGTLLFISGNLRPDVLYAVSQLAQHCERPNLQHWTQCKRVLKYLMHTVVKGISIIKTGSTGLSGYLDSNFAEESTMRYVVMVGDSVVSWRSCKQTIISLSVAEADFIALATLAQKVLVLRKTMEDLGIGMKSISLRTDSRTAEPIVKNDV